MSASVVVVVARDASCELRAQELSSALGLPLVREQDLEEAREPSEEGALLLEVTPERLQLRPAGKRASGPVSVELSAGNVGRRRREPGLFKTPLARAIGVTRTSAPFVLDATAGLGTDSALLAWMGCRVHAVERNAVLAALWRDALSRLEGEAPDVAARVTFEHADAREVLSRVRPDVVYLDPMFPPRGKTALVKKGMQVLHALHGGASDDEAEALLAIAKATASKRVVVKRPRGKAPLAPGVTHAREGSTTRLDVYVVSAA